MINNLTILCPTCSAFSDMWDNQIESLNKYWVDHPRILFITDDLKKDFNKAEMIVDNEEYSNRLIFALKQIDTEYVLLTLDDYLVSSYINDKNISNIINYMKENNIDYCKLRKARYGKFSDKKNKIKSLPLAYTYEVSFLPGLWKKDSFLKLLTKNLTPWQTEVSLTKLAKKESLNCVSLHNNNVYPYVDIVRKGKYLRKGYKYLKKNGYFISDRPLMPIHESIIRGAKSLIFNAVPLNMRERISASKGTKSYSGSNVVNK